MTATPVTGRQEMARAQAKSPLSAATRRGRTSSAGHWSVTAVAAMPVLRRRLEAESDLQHCTVIRRWMPGIARRRCGSEAIRHATPLGSLVVARPMSAAACYTESVAGATRTTVSAQDSAAFPAITGGSNRDWWIHQSAGEVATAALCKLRGKCSFNTDHHTDLAWYHSPKLYLLTGRGDGRFANAGGNPASLGLSLTM